MAMTSAERVAKTRALRRMSGLCIKCGASSTDDPAHVAHKEMERERRKRDAVKRRDRWRSLEKGRRRVEEFRDRANAIKALHGCEICKEKHPACLEFHHRNPSEKAWAISKMVNECGQWAPIADEINKCMVLCANCHRKQHWIERGGVWREPNRRPATQNQRMIF